MTKSLARISGLGLLAALPLFGQPTLHTVQVCDVTGANCYDFDSSKIGGLRFEDYKVTNPAAVQFDPAIRLKELAALGSNASTMCQTSATFVGQAPSITFDKTSVVGQIYWVPVGPSDGNPFEFMDVQFKNFTASNGFSSPNTPYIASRSKSEEGTEPAMTACPWGTSRSRSSWVSSRHRPVGIWQ